MVCPRKQHRGPFPAPQPNVFGGKEFLRWWGSAPISEVAIVKWLLRSTFAGANWSCRGSLKLPLLLFPLKFCFCWSQNLPAFLLSWVLSLPSPGRIQPSPAFPAHPCQKLQASPGQTPFFWLTAPVNQDPVSVFSLIVASMVPWRWIGAWRYLWASR